MQPTTKGAAQVAAVIVTWNRKQAVADVLAAIARQTYGPANIHVTVVDNASSDGTLEHLASLYNPDRIVDNPTEKAHEPRFQAPRERPSRAPNTLGLGSLTIVRNTANHGGCGGFNTGFSYVENALAPTGPGSARASDAPISFLWLVDDDVDLPPDALEHLAHAMHADHRIGLVGSRTEDFNNRGTTIETTIYFDPDTGRMSDEPPHNHPRADEHRAWAQSVGGTRGRNTYHGLRDVDVVSACSMLARWSAVEKIGFWDYRYFIYCDDADWCLRFAKAGWRVVLYLDAVVYHTPWHHKLTPARAYYAQRNILWVIQKIMPADRLRRVTRNWSLSVLKQSLHAAIHRRLFHADIIRRSIDDMITLRWGKLTDDGPRPADIGPAFRDAGLLRHGAHVVVMCDRPDVLPLADDLRSRVASFAQSASLPLPRWSYIIRNDVPDPAASAPDAPARIVYSHRRRSKLRRQVPLLIAAPDAAVVFDQSNDFPLLRAGLNIHIDRRTPDKAQVERAGLSAQLGFAFRWTSTVVRSLRYAATVSPYVSPSRYG